VRDLAADLTVNCLGEIDAARIGERLQPGSQVDAVAIGIATFDRDIAEIDANAQDDAAALRQIAVRRGHGSLPFNRGLHAVVRSANHYDPPVTRPLDDATVMAGDEGLQYFLPPRPESSQHAGVVVTHEPAIADHISSEDGGKPALDGLFLHRHQHAMWR